MPEICYFFITKHHNIQKEPLWCRFWRWTSRRAHPLQAPPPLEFRRLVTVTATHVRHRPPVRFLGPPPAGLGWFPFSTRPGNRAVVSRKHPGTTYKTCGELLSTVDHSCGACAAVNPPQPPQRPYRPPVRFLAGRRLVSGSPSSSHLTKTGVFVEKNSHIISYAA